MGKAQETRKYILEKAFSMVYENGFQATSIDKILTETHVTKGAFYYHFKNKDEMGIAIIKEILALKIEKHLMTPLKAHGNKGEVISNTFKKFMLSTSERQLRLGCPTNNLIQEMSPLNKQFAKALFQIITDWKRVLSEAIQEGITQGTIVTSSAPEHMADFIIASYEGARSLGKVYKSHEYYQRFIEQLDSYLKKR